ncbi:hypothetical protein [Lewinella sp. W8]|uniref:hypothetical protein n=1 Tax=Lewinella sp. W8 TaxID=2528208 RepID=UPI001068C8D1|nr:hypothetical protein [Lewinella sp. W8]MTB53530.1 hypothetical protein [Lewinella sp. W8]
MLLLFLPECTLHAQSVQQEKMEQLSFLVGEWVGTSKIFDNGVVSRAGAAYEKIAYDLDKNILVIELNTEFLQLHTIVTYDEKDQRFNYHRFSKDGAAIYPAEFRDGQLVVWRDDKTRFFFGSTPGGGFREYGERLVDGEWVKTFEDTFVNTQ